MAIVQRLIEITTFQRGPQDMPYSVPALASVILVGIGLNLASLGLGPRDISPWLTLGIFFGYTAAFIDGVLQLKGLAHRRVQTLLAVFGTDAIIVTVEILALAIGDWSQPTATLATLALILLAWQLAVMAHILRHALSCGMGQAAAWTLAYLVGVALLNVFLAGGQA